MRKSKPKPRRSSTPSAWGWRLGGSPWRPDALGAGGVFETLRSYRGRVFAVEEHLDRLLDSARTLGLRLPQPRAPLARALARLARQVGGDATLRVMVAPVRGRAQVTLMGRRLQAVPRAWYARGIAVTTAVPYRYDIATVPPQAKHMDILPGVVAYLDDGASVGERLYRTPDGMLAEGTVSNVCMVTRAGELVSPPPGHGVLAGVTCQHLMQLASTIGLSPAWRPLTRHEAWNAAELFVTNTTFEVLPVVRYDGRQIGTGRPGPWTRELHAAFRAHVAEVLA